MLCPSNTFMATPLAARAAGAEVVFVDCNRDDLCVSFADFEEKALRHRPRAAFLVHIGGHIAFEVERIAEFCRAEGIFLIEDCAHAHGASFHERRAGTWGDAGIWSFAATKTISTGEGGMLVSADTDLVSFARTFRDYGKPGYDQPGLNLRMSEFTAALGIVGTERLDEITAWKNAAAREWLDADHPDRVQLPARDGLGSLQVHRVPADRAIYRQGVRRALPSRHGPRRRSAQHGLGRTEPLVRPPLLPPVRIDITEEGTEA